MKPLGFLELRTRLAGLGLDTGDEAAWRQACGSGQDQPWFVSTLLALGGWLAGGMIAAGLGTVLAIKHSGPSLITLGVLLCAGTCFLRRQVSGAFAVQMALALSIAGQLMLFTGFEAAFGRATRMSNGFNLDWALMVLCEAALFVLYRDTLHRILSAAAAGVFLALALGSARLMPYTPGLLCLALLAVDRCPPRTWAGRAAPFHRPLLLGLSLAALGTAIPQFQHGFAWSPYSSRTDLSAATYLLTQVLPGLLPGLALVLVLRARLPRMGLRPGRGAGAALMAAAALLALLGLRAPGAPVGFLALLLGIAHRDLPLLVLGAAGASGHLFLYYYDLELSLLLKSGLLAAPGALLLLLRAWLRRRPAC